MEGYIRNRIVPQASEAKNSHNANGGTHRFFFRVEVGVEDTDVTIFYYNESRVPVDLYTFTLEEIRN